MTENKKTKHSPAPLELPEASRAMQKKDKGWRITAVWGASLIIVFLTALGALSIFLPKPEKSVYELRELAKKPEFSFSALFSGRYISDLELYYSDTFPLREQFVKLANRITKGYGIQAGGVRLITAPGDAVVSTEEENPANPADPPAGEPPANPADPPAAQDPGPAPEKLGDLYVVDGMAFSLFGTGSNTMADYYSNTLNLWQETLGPGVTIYNLIVPTHSAEFSLPAQLQGLSAPQKPNIDYIYSKLNPSIRSVDAFSELERHKNEYIYFSTDHHWTRLGAYYAYIAFCQKAGLTPVPLDQMEKKTIPDYFGSFASQMQGSGLLKNPDYVDYWTIANPHQVTQFYRGNPFYGVPAKLLIESANSYSVFLGGDYPLTKVVTETKNGRKIAMVKESFGNAFAPFLVNHYEEVYVIDQRYFQLNLPAFLQQNGIHELLFINNIFAANTRVRIDEVARLRTQAYVPPEVRKQQEEEQKEETKPQEPVSSAEEEKQRITRGPKKVQRSSSEEPKKRTYRDDLEAGLLG